MKFFARTNNRYLGAIFICLAFVLSSCGGGSAGDTPQPMFKGELTPEQVNIVLQKSAEINTKELQAEEAATATGVMLAQKAMLKAGTRVTVYRFYNTQTAAHFYTTSETEKANVIANMKQFAFEGPAFYSNGASGNGLSPVYRFYNTQTGVHFYTISEDERAHIALNLKQFNYEGIAYYASKTIGEGLVGLYRFYVPSKGFHFYTASETERDKVISTNANYKFEGLGYYVFNSGIAVEAPNNISGTVRENLLVVSKPGTTGGNTVESASDGGLLINSSDAALASASVGQLAHVPAATGGLDFPFTGRIASVATVAGKKQVRMEPVNLEDVFEQLSWDVDTKRSGTKIAGFISPPGVKSSFSLSPSSQKALEKALVSEGGSLSGDVQLALEFETVKNGITKTVTLAGEINVANLSMRTKGEFDPLKYVSYKGWGHLSAVMSGSVGGKVSLKGEAEGASLAALIPTLSAWDKLKWEAGKYFSLEGLDDTDKKGKVPMGGLVLSPVLSTAFVGNAIPGSTLSALSVGPAVVLWLYFDASGTITVEGEAGWQAEGYSFERGYEFKLLGPLLVPTQIDIETTRGTQSLFASGNMLAQQRLGVSLSGDFFLAGIRPVNLNAFVGVEGSSEAKGEGVYQISPTTQLTGNLCSHQTLWTGVDLDAAFRVKADFSKALPFIRAEKGLTVQGNYNNKLTWKDGDFGGCVASGPFSIAALLRGPDQLLVGKALVDLDFSAAYNNAAVRSLTDTWRVTASCGGCPSLVFDIPANKAGLATISVPTGKTYTLKLDALSAKAEVIKSAATNLVVGSAPSASFTVVANAGNCASLTLNATATASSGRTIAGYGWQVQRAGATAQAYSGKTVSNASLPSCGTTQVQLTVTDNQGFTTSVGRTLDTTSLGATVTGLTPTTADLNQPTAFTVTGTNLPSTAVMAITDAECQVPVNNTVTSFQQTCTPRGIVGSKAVTIKTNTGVNGGLVIDNSRVVVVSTAAGLSSKMPNSGITSNQCYTTGSNNLVACSSTAAIELNSQQDGHRSGINTMGYQAVGSFPNTSCVRDTVTGLIWEGKESIGQRSGGNTFTNHHVDFGASQSQMDAATNAQGYVNLVNGMALCGYTDWRLPSVLELISIVDYGSSNSLAPGWFPNSSLSNYWTNSRRSENPTSAWMVSFSTSSRGTNEFSSASKLNVRLVRGGPSALLSVCEIDPGRITDVGSGMLDNKTKLIWNYCPISQNLEVNDCSSSAGTVSLNHENALKVANYHFSSGWRLPSVKELSTAYRWECSSSGLGGSTWTSTPDVSGGRSYTVGGSGVGTLSRGFSAAVILVKDAP